MNKTELDEIEARAEEAKIEVETHTAEEQRKKRCNGCVHRGKYENEIGYGYACPCLLCSRRNIDNYRPLKGGE